MNSNTEGTINAEEVEFFKRMSGEWRNPEGPFILLHKLNPLRIQFILNLIQPIITSTDKNLPMQGIKVLDIGCGGALLTIELAKLGASVVAIDVTEENIKASQYHINEYHPDLDITFHHQSIESLASVDHELLNSFDIVIASEVIEHVNNYQLFLKEAISFLRPDGYFFGSTMNKTLKSLALAKLMAEYVLRWVPINTHDWEKFLPPSDFKSGLENNNLKVTHIQGIKYNLFQKNWSHTSDLSMNYFIGGKLNQ